VPDDAPDVHAPASTRDAAHRHEGWASSHAAHGPDRDAGRLPSVADGPDGQASAVSPSWRPSSTPERDPRPRRPLGRSTALRLVVGALALTTAGAIGAASEPPAAAAGRSCTGWTSKIVPPRTIRVLRTRSGRVQKVNFRRYVAEVMASGEWPARLHMTTLEAGAVATKQYAWYYALKGHHRPGFSRNGRCYDVRDDTMDQLFRPERARPGKRQLRAIAATWDLTLRKNGRFFLTGYRAGSTGRCAADANGWKLYARSVQACARKGWSRQRVQRAYLSPNLTFVWGSRIGPLMRRPRVTLRAGNRLPGDAATVTWRARSKRAQVSGYVLQRRVGKGPWRRISLDAARARRADVWVKPGKSVRFRVRALDRKGDRGRWAYSRARRAAILHRDTRILGAGLAASSERPSARVRFRAHSVGLIAQTGPGLGKARIFLNGRRVAEVDLSSERPTARTLVWSRNFERASRRSIRVVPTEGKVILSGFLVLR
jgi:hypothetical protein